MAQASATPFSRHMWANRVSAGMTGPDLIAKSFETYAQPAIPATSYTVDDSGLATMTPNIGHPEGGYVEPEGGAPAPGVTGAWRTW
jgi:hypothetical protein